MYRYFLFFQYKGSKYHGWQVQPNAHSVQAEMEAAIQIVFQKDIPLVAAGRTDTGVHAKQMVAHFELDEIIVTKDFIFHLNNILPSDISIDGLSVVKPDFHARFDAISRTYEYHIAPKKHPFLEGLFYRVSFDLDFEKMNLAAKDLLGKNDFSCFSKSKTQTYTNDCEILKAEWYQKGDLWVFEVKANRFLRNMVRAMVGTLIEIGQGKRPADSMKDVIASKNRSVAGVSVPAEGLFLTQIEYPEEGFLVT